MCVCVCYVEYLDTVDLLEITRLRMVVDLFWGHFRLLSPPCDSVLPHEYQKIELKTLY